MEVIYKGNSKRLIKNHHYIINRLYNDGSNKPWIESKLEIENLGIFDIKTFTDINGNSLPKINYGNPKKIKSRTEFSELKKGDILICKVTNLKTLIYDRMYIIEDIITEDKDYTSSVGILGIQFTRKIKNECIKFKGINRKIKYSPWKFDKIETDVQREMSLQLILNDKVADIVTFVPSRKIDVCDDKEKKLLELVAKSILDKSRHHYTIMEWVYKQIGKEFGVNEQDYDDILNLKFSEILNLIE